MTTVWFSWLNFRIRDGSASKQGRAQDAWIVGCKPCRCHWRSSRYRPAIALALARAGAQLAIVDVDVAGLDETLSLLKDLSDNAPSRWVIDLSQPGVHAHLISMSVPGL